jgi:hypothetical protein
MYVKGNYSLAPASWGPPSTRCLALFPLVLSASPSVFPLTDSSSSVIISALYLLPIPIAPCCPGRHSPFIHPGSSHPQQCHNPLQHIIPVRPHAATSYEFVDMLFEEIEWDRPRFKYRIMESSYVKTLAQCFLRFPTSFQNSKFS